MRLLNLILFTLLSNLVFSQSLTPTDTIVQYENIVGEWLIDLRPSPDATPYMQTFVVSKQDGDNFTGLFYGSPIKGTSLNKSWDRLYFAFKSSDNTHDYYQSGYIIGDKIFGITFCPGRNFVMPWSGARY